MSNYRFTLEKYCGPASKYDCPQCENSKTFTRYIDNVTGKHLDTIVGRCDRLANCGYHYKPKEFFREKNISFSQNNLYNPYSPKKPIKLKPISFIDKNLFIQTLNNYDSNNFVLFLTNLFNEEIVTTLIRNYYIGTIKNRNNSTIFWQIDINGNIRTGKSIQYNSLTGKRSKDVYSHINWIPNIFNLPKLNFKQCLFGEHLLKDISKPIAIVESEKTAIIASVFFPDFIWLATGGLSNLNADKCSVLKGRKVFLFPDLNGFDRWSAKAKEMANITHFNVSDLLERKASDYEKEQGLDLADYLINRINLQEFSRINNPSQDPKIINKFLSCQFKNENKEYWI